MFNQMSPEIQPWVPGVLRQKSLQPRFAWWLYCSKRCENLGIISIYLGLSFLISKIRLFKFSKFPSCFFFFFWVHEKLRCLLDVCWNLQPWPDVGPFSVCLLQEPQLSPHTENTELRRWKEGNQWSWRMRNPKEKQGNGRGAVCQGRWG